MNINAIRFLLAFLENYYIVAVWRDTRYQNPETLKLFRFKILTFSISAS